VAVVVALLALQIGYGADLGDALLYMAYQFGFIVLPGWLAYRALSSRPGGAIRQLAIGWALGYVLEILAFMLTAAIGARGLLIAYPVVVAAVAIVWISRRRKPFVLNAEPPQSSRFTWLVATVCLVAVGYVGLTFFSETPLPGDESVRYFPDHSWAISIAAEARHHWPIEDPSVAGEPFPYHYFVHVHLAAASQVTGVDLPLMYFRLFLLPLIVLLVLALVAAGQSLARSAQAGLIAAGLALLIGQLQMDLSSSVDARVAFLGVFFTYMTASPTFLFGLVMFVPLITLIGERLADREGMGHPGVWLLITLLAIGASNAKVVVLPLVAGGLVLFMGWSYLARRSVSRAAFWSLGVTLLVLGAVYLLQYRGHSSGMGVEHSFRFFIDMPVVSQVRSGLADVLPEFPGRDDLLIVGSIPFGVWGLLGASLVGLVWIFRSQGLRLQATQAWLLSLFAAGLVAVLALTSPAGNDHFFFFTGLVAGCVLAGQGLWSAWEGRPRLSERAWRIAAVGASWVLVVVAIMIAPDALDLFAGPNAEAHTLLFWYGGLLLSLLALYFLSRRWLGPARWPAVALVCGGVILVGAVDIPAQNVRPALAASVPSQADAMSAELYGALTWIRDETSAESVIAVNDQQSEIGPYEFDFGAFSERRVFLAGWGYSGDRSQRHPLRLAGDPTSNPYPERLALNQSVFQRPDPNTLGLLREEFDVRYLVVDELNGYPADLAALRRIAKPVYEVPGVVVFELS
jgi:hypothetical protein